MKQVIIFDSFCRLRSFCLVKYVSSFHILCMKLECVITQIEAAEVYFELLW